MKHTGSYFEYEKDRNCDLMRAFRTVMAHRNGRPMKDVYERIVEMPSKRFWVSEQRATNVVSLIIKGNDLDDMRPNKRAMFKEIHKRVMDLKKTRPNDSIYSLTFDVVNSQAPRFYLTPDSAHMIILKIKNQWYEAREWLRV